MSCKCVVLGLVFISLCFSPDMKTKTFKIYAAPTVPANQLFIKENSNSIESGKTNVLALDLLAQDFRNDTVFEKSQAELFFDDSSRESYYCIDQSLEKGFSMICVYIESGACWSGFLEQHRIAVQFKSPFGKSKLINTQIFHSHLNESCKDCKFDLEILDENWNSIEKMTVLSEKPGIAKVEFGDHDIIVGKIFSIALNSENMKDICIDIDNSSSGHSYVIFEDNIPTKIEDLDSNNFFKKFNDGKYDFMIRAVVEETE